MEEKKREKRQHVLTGIIIFSFVVFVAGLFFAVTEAIPYQDPTPELLRKYQTYNVIGWACMGLGVFSWLTGCIVKTIFIIKDKSGERKLPMKWLTLYSLLIAVVSVAAIIVGAMLGILEDGSEFYNLRPGEPEVFDYLLANMRVYFGTMIVSLGAWFGIVLHKKVEFNRRSIFAYTFCLCGIFAVVYWICVIVLCGMILGR